MCCALLRIVAWPCPALCFGPRPTLTAAGSSWQQLTSAVWAIALRTSPAATPKTEDVAMFESKTTSISAHLFPKGNINIIEHHWTSWNITKVKHGMLPLTLEICEFTGLSNFPTASRVDLASCGTVTSEPPARPKTSHRTCVLKLRTYSILDSIDSASTFVVCQIIDNPW